MSLPGLIRYLSRRHRALLHRLLRQTHGAAVLEFALVAPVFLLLLLGAFDIAHMAYARAVFEGAVERAARDSSLETADTGVADQRVEGAIRPILPDVVLHSTRRSYFDFADIARSEKFSDTNGNSVCDNGESYIDENGSGSWDPDIGVSGNGGAGDVVMYTVTATYTPIFRVPFMPNAWNQRTLQATAVKKNQPFGNQQRYVTTAGTCTD